MAVHRSMRSCRLADSLYQKAKYIAGTENRSFNNWVENLIETIVAEYEEKNGSIPTQSDDLDS